MRVRVLIGSDSIPSLPRGVRLHHDVVRDRHVLLVPERVLALDVQGLAVLERCDGRTQVADIAGDLAATFDAPEHEIEGDVIALLQDLADRGLVRA